MDDAHNDVNVNAPRRERAREPNQLAGLAYSFVLEAVGVGVWKALVGCKMYWQNTRKLTD
ncbi:hypothetical protein N7471_002736 [Penicillium samsonianum]|uniref:uncharacterized protein n=1 Tax=Penicillium samsonianum TaxID=1882272 RepID=UPI00254688C5|nr:uncharacterized protein N7471_002736 [Penicillium samsonianum]KAJ6143283.1 hypothetical protein N7471_002736 [Penicillium samsonianum]